MKLNITREWLARWLARADDTAIGAGGSDLRSLKQDVERRTVTPPVLADIPSQLGQAVRFVREQRGWSPEDLARIADVDVHDIILIETSDTPELSPRAAVYLADALGFSRTRLQELARLVQPPSEAAPESTPLRFAAISSGTHKVSDDQYEAVRALVAVLAEKEAAD